MKTSNCVSTFTFILLAIFSCLWAASADEHKNFLRCLSEEFKNYSSISNDVYTPINSSYTSVLQYSLWNLRFTSESTPRPQVIITPEHESQIPPLIFCAKENDLQIRVRSGGHDFEAVSSVAYVPFVIIDLINLSEVSVDAEEKTAWVGGGATLGSLYYRIAEKSPVLGFPAGLCPTVGVGGYFTGGGYGPLMRKYGLAADNVIDARIVDVNGRILDRKSMGEDLFWAIRGGGGGSFGIVVAWKVQLVDVPETVTVFTIQRTLEQNATQLLHRWQYIAPNIDRDLWIAVLARRVNSSQDGRNMTISVSFFSLFLGGIDRLLPLMQENFPELGLQTRDCTEMSWIQSVLYIADTGGGYSVESPEDLLNRTQPFKDYLKGKTSYVQKPIPEYGLEGIWRLYLEPEAGESTLYLVPYGGKMDDIPESAIPFPHRAGNLYKLANLAYWQDAQNSDRTINWARRVYSYETPFVANFPRAAYVNYRDLDLGVNNIEGKISYAQASIWGKKYFKNNFNRLVSVKSIVDPKNFFRHEQSIPPLDLRWIK